MSSGRSVSWHPASSPWSRAQDKKLFRLICYLDTSAHYRLIGRVCDPAHLLKLLLFVDADFAGESDSSKSTSGGLLVLVGPNTWFPIAAVHRTQTATSRSSTESEVVSFAESFFSEAIPALDLLELVLERQVELIVLGKQ